MPTISVPVNHKLGQVEAIRRVKNFGSNTSNLPPSISDLKVNWAGNKSEFTFLFNKILIKGSLIIGTEDLTLTGRIPLLLLPLKGKIVNLIKGYAENILK